MANEIQISGLVTGVADYYFRLRNAAGSYWNNSSAAFETYNASNIALYGADTGSGTPYNVMTEVGATGAFLGSLHASVVAGEYQAEVCEQAGTSPVEGDTVVGIVGVDTITVPQTADHTAAIATAQADLDIITGADGVNLLSGTQASIDAIEGDTNELQVDDYPTRFDTLDAAVSSILTAAMTESYAAAGAAPTAAQALYMIQQAVTEFAIVGTTKTIKKLDGSTTAATQTLDDDTSPTSITRAT